MSNLHDLDMCLVDTLAVPRCSISSRPVSISEVAKKLTLSTETVRNHARSVLRELHVHTRLEAIAAARRRGLLAQPALRPLPAPGAGGALREP